MDKKELDRQIKSKREKALIIYLIVTVALFAVYALLSIIIFQGQSAVQGMLTIVVIVFFAVLNVFFIRTMRSLAKQLKGNSEE